MEAISKDISIEEYSKILINEINQLLNNGTLLEIYNKRNEHWSEEAYLNELAEIKRFLELWSADSAFRAMVKNGEELPEKYHFDLDLEELRSLWDENAELVMPPLTVLRYKAFCLEKLTHRNVLRENDPTSMPAYNAWRSRQLNRCNMQLRPAVAYGIVHAPFSIELCSGCSVGCWFCGISAPKLDDIFFYTEENAVLFKEVILALKEIFGEAAGKGFNYWATDPMDNPDYEKFMVDFHKYTGVFPQTTTALPLKDVERTRKLLQLSRQLNGQLDRFSILSLHQLRKVFEHFTAEELLFVEVVTQNQEAFAAKSKAGRAITGGAKRVSDKSNRTGNQVVEGTIACVSGFLISMVKKTVQLISPCQASERWPLGYIVFEEGTFSTGAEFRDLVRGMVKRQMNITLDMATPMAFWDYLEFESYEDGFAIRGPHLRKSFRSHPFFAKIGPLINGKQYNADEIMGLLEFEEAYPRAETYYLLNEIFNEGVIAIDK